MLCLAGSRSSSPQRSAGSRLVPSGPPDVAAVQRPGSSLGMRSRAPTHRVAQSQGCSREASPDRQRFGFDGTMQHQSELEAAVADALVSDRTTVELVMMTLPFNNLMHNGACGSSMSRDVTRSL